MRIRALSIFFFLFLAAIVLRLGYWQVVRADDMTALAEDQHLTSQVIEAPRGKILASDNSVLVDNRPTYLLFAQPKLLKDRDDTASKLSKILFPLTIPSDAATPAAQLLDSKEAYQFKDTLNQTLRQDLFWVPVQKNIDYGTKKVIDDLNIFGLGFDQQSTRYYPEASTGAHMLGFVGFDAYGKQKGYFGLEGFYNGELRGSSGVVTEEKDAGGAPILIGKFFKKEPRSGHNLVLHIDRSIQYIVEKKLKEGMEKYGAKSASVIVMDPKTGGIVALANYPTYDPQHYPDFAKDYFKNIAVADSYEPGSTFKVLQMAAAINEGLVTPQTICDICAGPVRIDSFDIRTWDNKYHANSTMNDVLVHSDNTGMVFIARKLGLDKMYDYIQKFGIGQPTKIDLQDETSPDIRPKAQWREIDVATASFGQGIAATAIQIVRAVASIANGGNIMEPHLVHYIQEDEKTIEIKPKIVSHPITDKTAKTVTQMMVDAVDLGEASYYKKQAGLKDFKIAGKTGTAQIPVAGHYDATKTIASFIGFAPADDPKFVMLVRYTEPTASIYGADTAAPTFFAIAKELFTYWSIAP